MYMRNGTLVSRVHAPTTPSIRPSPERIQELLLFRLNRLMSLGGGIVTRLCEGRFGITRREWAVLACVAPHEEIRWADLVATAELDEARLSRAVSLLAAKDLVRKETTPEHTLKVVTTPSGKALYDDMFPLTRELNLKLLDGLSSAEVCQLAAMLNTIHHRAAQMASEEQIPKANRRHGKAGGGEGNGR